MLKDTSAFSIIIFLFIILVAWWTVTSYKIPVRTLPVIQHTTLDTTFHAPQPIPVFHNILNGVHIYSGAFVIPKCDTLSSKISVAQGAPTRLELSVTISRPSTGCDSTVSVPSVPFSVTYPSMQVASTSILDSVKINNEAVTFTVVEAHIQ